MSRTKIWTVSAIFIAALLNPSSPAAQSASGSINGTVVFADGTPIDKIRVVALRADAGVSYNSSVLTDNMGRYRAEKLPPGSYYVKAGVCEGWDGNCPVDSPVFVYHPGTTSSDSATIVTITAASEIKDVNFRFTTDEVRALQEKSSQLQKQAQELWGLRPKSAIRDVSKWSSVEEMHNDFVKRFIATPGMGSGRMGGMTLEMDSRNRLLISKAFDGGKFAGDWTVATFDLIGIAKHEQPVVFSRVAHGVYRLDPRKLTDFENLALAELRAGRETSYRKEGDDLLLIGAIRAGDSCLGCHAGARVGDLLGAFRYTLKNKQT